MFARLVFIVLTVVQLLEVTTLEDDLLCGSKCGSKRDATDSISWEWSE